MKKHVMMAAMLLGAGLLVGCSSDSKTTTQTEAQTTAATEAVTEAAEEAATEAAAADETEAVTEEVAVESVAESVEGIEEGTEAETESAGEEIVELGARPTYTAADYVTLGEYTGLAVEVDPVEVTEEEVDAALSSAVRSAGLYETLTEGTVQDGDIANIDYEGKKDDVAFDGGTAEGYDLTIGSGTFIDGFEAGLVGVSVGDTVDLDLTFPENYGSEELAGADVVFTVTVNSVQRVPEVTDDLISEMTDGEYTTVDGYRDMQRQQLVESEQSSQDSLINNELMAQLYNTCEVTDYPQDLIDYSVQEMNNYYISYATAYGMTLDEFISSYFGMDRETYDTQAEEAIKSSLEQELLLIAIAEAEGLELTDEAYAEGCANYAEQMGFESVDEFTQAYDENKIRSSLLMDMAMDFVRENAVITEIQETEAVTEAAAEETEAVTEAAEEETEAVTEAVTE